MQNVTHSFPFGPTLTQDLGTFKGRGNSLRL